MIFVSNKTAKQQYSCVS